MIYPRKATTLFPQICENGEMYKNAVSKKEFCRRMDLKVDYAFRRLFGDERNKKITIAFLNAFFTKLKRAQIQDLKFQNWEAAKDEKSHLTMLVETKDKESIYVEILFPNKDAPENQIEQQLLQEIETLEQKRKIAEERAELAEKRYKELKRQYEQHKLKIAEEKMKKLEADKKSLLANREAAKIIIRYGNIVARNLFAQGMDSKFVQDITGLSDQEVAMLKLQIEEENMKDLF